MKIWLLTNAPSPYQIEFLETLASHPNVELSVRFMRGGFRTDASQPIAFESEVLKSWGISRSRDELRFHPRAIIETWANRFDAYILSGLYTSPTFLLSALVLWIRRKPFCLWLERPSESHRKDLPFWRHLLRLPFVAVRFVLLRTLFAMARSVVCIGTRAKAGYSKIGLPSNKGTVIPYCTNNSRFAANETQFDPKRNELGLVDKVIFLTSGQLIHRKGIDVLIRAYRNVADQYPHSTALLILGDGPERATLETLASQWHLGDIRFLGHQSQQELPSFFHAADVFVFPSRHDGWGVVVNEAAASGLPIIASKEAGATYDLVVHKENGFHFESDNVDELTKRMLELYESTDKRKTFGTKSRELASSVSVECGALKFVQVLEQITNGAPR